MAKMRMILDVEGMSGKRPYNIGYLIGDGKGNIFQERSIALPETIWENLANCAHAREMTHKNIEEILMDYGSEDFRKYDYESIVNTLDLFEYDLNRFKVAEIWAYNCSFDKSEQLYAQISATLKRLRSYKVAEIWAYNCSFDKSEFKNLYGDRIMPDVEWCDIWSAVTYSRCMTQKYIDFCLENGFVTEKGNIKTSAEVVYAYMTKNPTFCEEHTGLADCHIEYALYLWAKSSKQKMVKKHPTPIWKVMAQMMKPAD